MSDLLGNHIVGFPTRRLKCYSENCLVGCAYGLTSQSTICNASLVPDYANIQGSLTCHPQARIITMAQLFKTSLA